MNVKRKAILKSAPLDICSIITKTNRQKYGQ